MGGRPGFVAEIRGTAAAMGEGVRKTGFWTSDAVWARPKIRTEEKGLENAAFLLFDHFFVRKPDKTPEKAEKRDVRKFGCACRGREGGKSGRSSRPEEETIENKGVSAVL